LALRSLIEPPYPKPGLADLTEGRSAAMHLRITERLMEELFGGNFSAM
jgi:hypothetical protein